MSKPDQNLKVCLLEFWGLGDAIMMTPILQAFREAGVSVTLFCKPATRALLEPTYPWVHYVPFDPPWTVFRGKYRLWKWPWPKLLALIAQVRREHFTWIASVRKDPRDHLLMALSGSRRRVGFPRGRSGILLSDPLPVPETARHIVDDWRAIQERILPGSEHHSPHLATAPAESAWPTGGRPIFTLHCGARIPVRRWPISYFRDLVGRLRTLYDFHLRLIPDPDGYGSELRDLADEVLVDLAMNDLVSALASSDLLLGNDSAPGHIADAVGTPAIAIFGPTHPVRFRPYSERNLVVIRDICPLRPCLDYCRFPEPNCLTLLSVDEVWPEIRAKIEALIDSGDLPRKLREKPRA